MNNVNKFDKYFNDYSLNVFICVSLWLLSSKVSVCLRFLPFSLLKMFLWLWLSLKLVQPIKLSNHFLLKNTLRQVGIIVDGQTLIFSNNIPKPKGICVRGRRKLRGEIFQQKFSQMIKHIVENFVTLWYE